MDAQKGYDLLLESLIEVLEDTELQVVIVGAGRADLVTQTKDRASPESARKPRFLVENRAFRCGFACFIYSLLTFYHTFHDASAGGGEEVSQQVLLRWMDGPGTLCALGGL